MKLTRGFEGVKIKLHVFFTSDLKRGGRSVSFPTRLCFLIKSSFSIVHWGVQWQGRDDVINHHVHLWAIYFLRFTYLEQNSLVQL